LHLQALFLRQLDTNLVVGSPFIKGIISFTVPEFVYGRFATTVRNDEDMINAMSKSMGSMGLYITPVFFIIRYGIVNLSPGTASD
jgi:aminobenzoyl-glutamate transport protein